MSIFGKRKRRVNPDDDAKYWCMAEDDKKHCLEKRYINDVIGFGVYSTKTFTKGSFILEYAGERRKAKEFEMKKEEKQTYVFRYKWNGEQYVIDATHSLDRLGRYVNDEAFGKPANNSVVKLKMINKQPRLCLFASRDIYEGEEIRYDYGDQEAPWRQEQIDASHEKSSSSQPLVMVTSCLDIKQIRSVRMLDNVKVKQLNNFDESVTHVIVNTDSGERICNRSMKFFYAVAFHCWILSYDWILHSLEAGHYLPEEDYEIIGDLASERKHGGPKKLRQLRNKLLNDLEIYVDERETNEVSRASLELLTKKCECVVKASLQELNKKSVVITCDAAENVSAEDIKKFQEWEVDDEADPLEDTFDDAEETMETSSYNAASSSSHEPQSSRSRQSSQEQQASRSQQSSQEPQSSRSQQSSQEPQSSRSRQSSQEPQSSRSRQSSQEPQSSRSQQSSQEQQASRSQHSSQEQQASTSDSSSSHEPQSSRSQQSSQEPQSSRSQQSSQEPQASRRVILSKEQTTTLKNIFRENILFRKELRRDQCERAAGQSPCLQNLGWKKIKNTIHNWITCEKRKMMAFSKKKK